VVEDVVQRQDRGFLAAVRVLRRREAGDRLLVEHACPPLATGPVEELLQLSRREPESGRTAERIGVRPFEVVEGCLGDPELGRIDIAAPRGIRVDRLLPCQLGYPKQAHVGPGLPASLGYRLGQRVYRAGGRVEDHCQANAHR